MGVKGLTTFFSNGSDEYLENYLLHNTKLILDGNSICNKLYEEWHDSSDSDYFECFGGDYDKFGKIVNDFFDLLKQCRIIPYIVFDGGYENRKLSRVMQRKKKGILQASRLNPVSEPNMKHSRIFCLFMRKTFEDIVNDRGINKVRCDLEGDLETSNIARVLGCPVLGFDSDYFIFANSYIPFDTLNLKQYYKNSKLSLNILATCINCKIYKMEKFLKSFNGLQKNSLPILSIILGNDFVNNNKCNQLQELLTNIACQSFDSNDRIKGILNWLKTKSPENAKKIILNHITFNKNNIEFEIENCTKSYNSADSIFIRYFNNPEYSNSASTSGNKDEDKTSPLMQNGNEQLDFDKKKVSPKFLEKFRQVIYPPGFMNILLQNKYYYITQIENNSREHSHKISYNILSAIHKILLNINKPLFYIGRVGRTNTGQEQIPIINVPVPLYSEIDSLDINVKKNYILTILDIDVSFFDCINSISDTWHIFLLSIQYYLDKSPSNWSLIHSIIICKLLLSYVDKKAGFFRSKKSFEDHIKYHPCKEKAKLCVTDNIMLSLDSISEYDSVECLKALIIHFEVGTNLTTSDKEFNRQLAHIISQFQSCLLHIGYLNILFDFPFSDFSIQECLNCTFIYNLTTSFTNNPGLNINVILKDAPNILNSFNIIVKMLQKYKEKQQASKRKIESTEEMLDTKKIKLSS